MAEKSPAPLTAKPLPDNTGTGRRSGLVGDTQDTIPRKTTAYPPHPPPRQWQRSGCWPLPAIREDPLDPRAARPRAGARLPCGEPYLTASSLLFCRMSSMNSWILRLNSRQL